MIWLQIEHVWSEMSTKYKKIEAGETYSSLFSHQQQQIPYPPLMFISLIASFFSSHTILTKNESKKNCRCCWPCMLGELCWALINCFRLYTIIEASFIAHSFSSSCWNYHSIYTMWKCENNSIDLLEHVSHSFNSLAYDRMSTKYQWEKHRH